LVRNHLDTPEKEIEAVLLDPSLMFEPQLWSVMSQ